MTWAWLINSPKSECDCLIISLTGLSCSTWTRLLAVCLVCHAFWRRSTFSCSTQSINLRQATMELRICCYKGVNWMIFSGASGSVSICCVWSSADICYCKYVRIEALRWISIVKPVLKCFQAGHLLFIWIINQNCVECECFT